MLFSGSLYSTYKDPNFQDNQGILDDDNNLPKTTRKLEVVEDPEMKARVVAIFDHFSQTFLNKISKNIYQLLKMIPSDRTFTQSPIFDHEGYIPCTDKYHSIDLSSATDRFPLRLQEDILNILYNSEYIGSSWGQVMVGEHFTVPSTYTGPLSFIKYAVGQPMGARSS